jgi:dTDP-4-amino-4,6-dideoxygalactose transaminase
MVSFFFLIWYLGFCHTGRRHLLFRSVERSRRALVLWEKGTNRYDFMTGKIDKYEWVDLGSSFVPSELGCAVLWAQLQAAKDITAKRVAQHNLYSSKLGALVEMAAAKGILLILPSSADCTEHNGHIYAVLLSSLISSPSPAADGVRQLVEKEFKRRGISCFSHYVPLHSSAAGKKYGRAQGRMLDTAYVFDSLLRLPMWIDMTVGDVLSVVKAFQEIIETCF